MAVALAATAGLLGARPAAAADDIRLITLAPGHFHAALIQKDRLPGVSDTVHVYAPLGWDLTAHLGRVAAFNSRPKDPTGWRLEVHAVDDFLSRMTKDAASARGPGVVVISGRNRGKIDLIRAALDAGLHVLADKPWIIESADRGKLVEALAVAERKRLLAYDIMTERFEASNALQRALVNRPDVFGTIETGSAADPAVRIEDVHHFMKMVGGRPNLRPPWFFDSGVQGEGMADTGTHLVDLVQWTLRPGLPLEATRDVRVLAAQRWPTLLPQSRFNVVTGAAGFPPELAARAQPAGRGEPTLPVHANTQVDYTLGGVYVRIASMWDWEAPAGAGDWKYVVYRGSRATVEVRQGRAEKFRPELYVLARQKSDAAGLRAALAKALVELQAEFPGVSLDERPGRAGALHVKIPDALHVGHEAHFSQVTRVFLRYLGDRNTLPGWEAPNLLTKYFTTTLATDLSRRAPDRAVVRTAPR